MALGHEERRRARPSSSCWACLLSETAARVNRINWCSARYRWAYEDDDQSSGKDSILHSKMLKRCACGWEKDSVGVHISIFSIIQFFIFIPIYCSHVYYVCLIWVLVYSFYSRKKNCIKHTRYYWNVLFFSCLISVFRFQIVCNYFSTVLQKIKDDTAFHIKSNKGSFILNLFVET